MLTATTNKAAVELGKRAPIHAATIYSALGLTVKPDYATGVDKVVDNSRNMLTNSIVFIDEASMIDNQLLKHISNKCHRCKVVFILDERQLLAVNATGTPALEKAGSNVLHLTQIMRQGAGSFIRQIGQELRDAINGGDIPDEITDGVDIVACSDIEFKEQVDRVFSNPDYSIDDGRILTWTNKEVHKYNTYVRKLRYGSTEPRIGEQLVTRKPIFTSSGSFAHFNEEIVKVRDINETTMEGVDVYSILLDDSYVRCIQAKDQLVVDALLKAAAKEARKSNSWYTYYSIKEMFSDLRPVYAGTVHTSQGSTYNEVFIDAGDLFKCKKQNELLRLLYVAITRARTKVWLRGYD